VANYTTLKFKAKVNDRFKEIDHLFTQDALSHSGFTRGLLWACQSHPFFKKPNADCILTRSYIGGVDESATQLIDDTLLVHTLFANYNQEIETFLDWISPHLDLPTVDGTMKYEEWYHAVPLIIKDNIIVPDRSKAYDEPERGFGLY
jgi:hypothetical protein